MDEPMTEEQRPVRGVVEVFIAFEMTALYKKGTVQFSCFRPIRLIPQPRLTGRNEKGFKDFLTKNAAWRSLRPHVVACSYMNAWSEKSPCTQTHTPPPVSPVHTTVTVMGILWYVLFSFSTLWAAQQRLSGGGTGYGWFINESPSPNTWEVEERQCKQGRHTCTNLISRRWVSLY